jgi:ComEC/Rec2-related protein
MYARRPALVIPLSLAVVIGMVLSVCLGLPWWWWCGLTMGSCVVVLAMDRGRLTPPVLLAIVMLGAATWASTRLNGQGVPVTSSMIGRLVVARVLVDDWPEARVLHIAGLPTHAVRGERIRLRGPGGYGQGAVLEGPVLVQMDARRKPILRPGAWTLLRGPDPPSLLTLLRRAASNRLRAVPAPTRAGQALVQASVLGRRSGDFYRVFSPFQNTGTAHLLAVSGLHLALVAMLVLALRRLVRASPRWDAPVLALTALFMLLLVEVRPPLARAAVMALVLAMGPLLHRRLAGTTALCCALLLALLRDPGALHRPGPQLSFAVVAGLVWLLPCIEARARNELRLGGGWARSWRAGWVAWVISTPIVLHHFGRMGPLAVPAALLMVPVLTVLLGAGWARICTPPGPWQVVIDHVTGPVLQASSEVLLTMVDWLQQLPGATWHGARPAGWWVLCAEAIVVTCCLRPGRWAWGMVGAVSVLYLIA